MSSLFCCLRGDSDRGSSSDSSGAGKGKGKEKETPHKAKPPRPDKGKGEGKGKDKEVWLPQRAFPFEFAYVDGWLLAEELDKIYGVGKYALEVCLALTFLYPVLADSILPAVNLCTVFKRQVHPPGTTGSDQARARAVTAACPRLLPGAAELRVVFRRLVTFVFIVPLLPVVHHLLESFWPSFLR